MKKKQNISEISRLYSIPRATILYWIKSNILNTFQIKEEINQSIIDSIYEHISSNKKDYSFILGLYLGDGCISQNGRNNSSYKLRISQDKKYPNTIKLISSKLSDFFGKNSNLLNSKGCYNISIYDKYLPLYFPQHGKGFKHDRNVKLNEFQRRVIDYRELMKGLWLSDGSFYLARNGKYEYERYNFTNKSLDIIELFEKCLKLEDVSYSKRLKSNNIWVIQIQNKKGVEILKSILGTKS